MMITVLAHGALGYWDEAILFAIVAVFLGFTVMSWLKNQKAPEELNPSSHDENLPKVSPSDSQPTNPDKSHFELD